MIREFVPKRAGKASGLFLLVVILALATFGGDADMQWVYDCILTKRRLRPRLLLSSNRHDLMIRGSAAEVPQGLKAGKSNRGSGIGI